MQKSVGKANSLRARAIFTVDFPDPESLVKLNQLETPALPLLRSKINSERTRL